MKRRILPLLLMAAVLCPGVFLGYVLYGPPAYRPPEMASEPVCLAIDGYRQPEGVRIVIATWYNNTPYFAGYGQEFHLERRQGKAWVAFDEAEIESSWQLYLSEIFPHSQEWEYIPLDVYTRRFGVGLEAGEYRVKKSVFLRDWKGGKIGDEWDVYAEFIVE